MLPQKLSGWFRCRVWWLAVAVSLAAAVVGRAGIREYNTRLWQTEEGLPNNIVQAVTQTADGYLWIGTREGLARFDGERFQPLSLGVNPPSVLCLLAAPDGALWIGTDNAGLFRWQAGNLKRYPAMDGQLDYSVSQLQASTDGSLWLGSSLGVLRLEGERMEVRAKYKSPSTSIGADAAGKLWLAGDGFLRPLEGADEVPPTALPRPGIARCIYGDSDGAFWIGSGKGLLRLQNGVTTEYPKAEGPQGFVGQVLRDRSGELWVGSYAGLSWLRQGKFVDRQEPDGQAYRIFAIFEDREQNVWVGSEEGLMRFSPRHFQTLTKRDGLKLNSVVALCASRAGGVWMSVWGGGLNYNQAGLFSYLGKQEGLSSNYPMGLLETRDGSLWIGTDYGGGLNRIKSGKVTTWGTAQGFSEYNITALYEDTKGRLWIGSREALLTMRAGRFRRFTIKDGCPPGAVNALIGGQDDTIWIGRSTGLLRWRDGRLENMAQTEPLLGADILSLYQDAGGALWIGTRGQGLLRWSAGKLHQFTTRDGLFGESLYAVLEDRRENLWLNSSRGIFRVSKQEAEALAEGAQGRLYAISYGRADGILSASQYLDAAQPAAVRDTDGRLWFRTTQGVVVVDPDEIESNRQAPFAAIQQMRAGQEVHDVSGLAVAAPATITLPPGRGELEFQYAGLSFRATERNQYRYRLDGADTQWVSAGTRRVATYSHLPPGDYRFRVLAANSDGVWSNQEATLAVKLRPYFWQTAWFQWLMAAVALGAVAGLSRHLTSRRLEKQMRRLEHARAVEQERVRIARDMHDELGARLTTISFQGASAARALNRPELAAQHLARISETARELILSMDRIVWAVDPENDTLESLANYLAHHATEFLEGAGLQCVLQIPSQLPPDPVSTEVRNHLFLAVNEALNNAAKHAKATCVTLAIDRPKGWLIVRVADNGAGISSEEPVQAGRRGGRGLGHLRDRLAAIGGRCEMGTSPGGGTEVSFSVPFP